MEKHKCKNCLRSFTNGRALGGHMRSLMVNQFNSKTKKEQPVNGDEENWSTQSSSSSEVRENLSFQGIENESECSKDPRIRIIKPKTREKEPISSVAETIRDEEIAYCLMMLKRDSWGRGEKHELGPKLTEQKKRNCTKVKAKYKCDTCGKVFNSYQALGGHKASHKKGLITNQDLKIERGKSIGKRNYQCPVCFKVFSSGQALGGHKRSHLSVLEANYLVDSPIKNVKSLIDLNLQPPIDDEGNENSVTASKS